MVSPFSWFFVKHEGCASYNVFVDIPKAVYDLVKPDKSSHSKIEWNKKLKKV